MDLKETFLSEETSLEGDFLTLKRHKVRLPDGKTARREYLIHPGAVLIAPILPDGRLVFERQYRYPIGRVCIELPAGKLDQNEDLLPCAQRELKEETGYSAQKWKKAIAFYNAIGYSNEKITLFIAENLIEGEPVLDEGEFLEVFPLSMDEALAKMEKGEIDDVKTMIALLWLAQSKI